MFAGQVSVQGTPIPAHSVTDTSSMATPENCPEVSVSRWNQTSTVLPMKSEMSACISAQPALMLTVTVGFPTARVIVAPFHANTLRELVGLPTSRTSTQKGSNDALSN